MPLYQVLSHFLPKLRDEDGCINALKANKVKWQSYIETEDNKKVYQIKDESHAVIQDVKGIYVHNVDAVE